MPLSSVRRLPRLEASARFSSICISAAVPVMGSWKTLPRYLARLYSGSRVTSVPSIVILPQSAGKTPVIRLRSVDLPAPFPPITVTKSPLLRTRSIPLSAFFSFIVPALKVLCTPLISSIGLASDIFCASFFFRSLCTELALPIRDRKE